MPMNRVFAIEGVPLPTGEMVRVASLCRSRVEDDCAFLKHLRKARRGDDSSREEYESTLESSVEALVKGLGGAFDAIVSPPSDHQFAIPYLRAFVAHHAEADDLTRFVDRASDAAQAGAAGTTLLDIIAGLRCAPLPQRPTATSLLIVDDIFEGGKTVAALLHVMREAGLKTRAVTVAAPLRILAP
ncbi:MAG TPA: hypothetical protein VF911_15500 [Thermoanaerobaculia bacterium]|jgi:hypothetical protein